MVGYNKEQIESLRNVINNIAKSSGEDIVNTLKNGFVIPMSSVWYAPDAVDFFNAFSELVKYSGNAVTESFDLIRSYIEKFGVLWAENTGGEIPVLPPIEPIILNLDISSIKPNNNGDVVINGMEANRIANNLFQLENNIKDNLKNLAVNLEAESSFIGGNQAESIQECFLRIVDQIQKIFDYLTNGDNSVQTQINKTISKYGDLSQNVSENFANKFVSIN